ncbi:hypothetical protein [uncultured Sphingomonas sp.]|uniref:hypothetical protein n=1 Tax=uncultured Sphingomonas sp. TaxID=158754 RepID=UPI0025F42721|nr:hypothetical protein [uncultured Sphingomonas sp.]
MSADLFAPEQQDDDEISTTGPSPFGEARFVVSSKGQRAIATIRAPDALVRGVATQYLDGEQPEPRAALVMDFDAKTISIFPQLIYFSDRLYGQKYRSIREIEIPLPEQSKMPTDHFGVVSIMREIPNGFIKDPSFGLGFVKEMRPLINSIEKINGVSCLIISERENTRVESNRFYLNMEEYLSLRNGMNRIARLHQAESLVERELMAHNASIHKARPDLFEFKERPYKPGTVFKLLGGTKTA